MIGDRFRAFVESDKRAQSGFAMRLEAVILPDLGTGPDEPIVVSYWFSARGDKVWEGDRLVEVLVGPATFDVPVPRSGRLTEIKGLEDDRVLPGDILGVVAVDEEDCELNAEGDGDAPPVSRTSL